MQCYPRFAILCSSLRPLRLIEYPVDAVLPKVYNSVLEFAAFEIDGEPIFATMPCNM